MLITNLKEHMGDVLTQSVLEWAIKDYFYNKIYKVTILGHHDKIMTIGRWETNRTRHVASENHEGLKYLHYLTEIGVELRVVYTNDIGDNILLQEGHLET